MRIPRMYRRIIVPLGLVMVLALPRLAAADAESEADEQTLKGAAVKNEGPALLDYLKKQPKPAKGAPDTVPMAVLRQVGRLKPAGSAEAIIAYLPNAASEAAGEEARAALARVAFPDGKLDKTITAGLTNTAPEVRSAAAEVLTRRAPSGHLADI